MDEQPWGTPHRHAVTLAVGSPFFAHFGVRDMTGPTQRREVIFIAPRPGGVLLHSKRHYPTGTFRLMSGTIEPGESVAAAIAREPEEELGLTLAVRRYVAQIDLALIGGGWMHPWESHLFLLSYSDAPLGPSLDDEIAATRVVPVDRLGAIADALDLLPNPDGWRDWGRYRAIAHRLAQQLVTPDELAPSRHAR